MTGDIQPWSTYTVPPGTRMPVRRAWHRIRNRLPPEIFGGRHMFQLSTPIAEGPARFRLAARAGATPSI